MPLLQLRAPTALRSLRRAQRRLWWQRFSLRMVRVAWLPVMAGALALALTRWAVLPQRLDLPTDIVVAALAAASLGFALWHRVALQQTAVRLDAAANSHDSLATAVYLASTQRSDGWAQVQADYAEKLAARLQIPLLLPWPRLGGWGSALLSLAVLAAAMLAPPQPLQPWQPVRPASGVMPELPSAPEAFASAQQAIGEDQAQLLTADARLLREIEEQLTDPATRKWIHDLREVVQAVQEGRIDKRQALEQLAALEAAKPQKPELDAALDGAKNPEGSQGQAADRDPQEAERQRDVAARNAVLDATKQAMAEAPEGEDKKALEKALEQGDLGLVAKALEKLAEKDLDAKTIEKWRKTLEKFADALKDAKVPKKLEELAKKIQRLEQQRAEQGGLNPSDQRRLQEARREAEQLRRDHGDPQAAQRQVQRLERQARQAADEMRRASEQSSRLGKSGQQGDKGQKGQQGEQGQQGQQGGKGQQAMKEAMRQAADELRRQDEGQKSRQAQRIGESRMRDLREALSREQNQRGQDRRGQPSEQPGGLQEGDEPGGRQAAGKERLQKGQSGSKKQSQDQHNSGDPAGEPSPEGGQPGQGEKSGAAGKKREFRLGSKGLGDKSRTELINEGYEKRSGQRGSGGQGQQQGDGGSQAGTTPGQKDGQGKKIGMQAARTEKLKGQQGSGPDVKQTFLDAARKGFSRQGWKEVYAEYSQVAEDMLDKEGLPAGRKALVRRYFEKIRPR